MSTVEVIQSDPPVVQVQVQATPSVTVSPLPPPTVQVMTGLQGPPGPPGIPAIGGFPIVVDEVIPENSLLTYRAARWTNVEQEELSDGGNF